MTGEAAIAHDTGMIKSRTSEIVGVMADATILDGWRVWRYRCSLSGSVNTVAIVVAGFAGHDRGVDQTVIEHATKAECCDFVTVAAIEGCGIDSRHRGMARRWVRDIVGGRYAMTGIATGPDNGWVGVIGKRIQKTIGCVTAKAFSGGERMGAWRGVGGCGRLADSRDAVVAALASTRDARMIKTAVTIQFKKTGGIVAGIAFAIRRHMKFGFTECHDTVMALAATSKHFLVIDKGVNRKSQRCMTGFAVIGGSDMKARFWRYSSDFVVMTNHAI